MTATTTATAPNDDSAREVRYLAPTAGDQLFNRIARRLTRMGLSLWGSRELTVVGRTSGLPRTTVVNLLTVGGQRYLVAPRGTTDWVRNLRAAGQGQLRVGRRVEVFTAVELDDDAKPELLRPYLERWGFEVGKFFDGVGADASDAELAAIAPNHPIFHLTAASSSSSS